MNIEYHVSALQHTTAHIYHHCGGVCYTRLYKGGLGKQPRFRRCAEPCIDLTDIIFRRIDAYFGELGHVYICPNAPAGAWKIAKGTTWYGSIVAASSPREELDVA